MNDELFVDIYERLYDQLNSIHLEDRYNIFYEVNPDCVKVDEKNNEYDGTNTIIFETKKYLVDILLSYQYDSEKIWNQYLLDFPRTDVYVQNVLIDNHQQLFEPQRELMDRKVFINGHKFSTMIVLALLCNQSSFAFPFTFLHNIYSDYDKNYMLSSCDQHSINFNYYQNSINVEIKANYSVRDTSNGTTVKKIENSLFLEINPNKSNFFEDCGIFKWSEIN